MKELFGKNNEQSNDFMNNPNKKDNLTLNYAIIELIIRYIYEFGPLELKRYILEYELTKTNRSLELLSESLSLGDKVDVNHIFKMTNEEFYSIGVLAKFLKLKINEIITNINNNDNLEDIDEFMKNIYKIISTLHPDYKTIINKWSDIEWSKNINNKSLNFKNLVSDDMDIIINTSKLKSYLPNNIIEVIEDRKQLDAKKVQLNQTINDLESIKSELEQLFLALLPIEDNYIN